MSTHMSVWPRPGSQCAVLRTCGTAMAAVNKFCGGSFEGVVKVKLRVPLGVSYTPYVHHRNTCLGTNRSTAGIMPTI